MKNSSQSFLSGMHAIVRLLRKFADSYVIDCGVFSDEYARYGRIIADDEKGRGDPKFGQMSLCISLRQFCGEIIGPGFRRIDPEKVKAVHETRNREPKKTTT